MRINFAIVRRNNSEINFLFYKFLIRKNGNTVINFIFEFLYLSLSLPSLDLWLDRLCVLRGDDRICRWLKRAFIVFLFENFHKKGKVYFCRDSCASGESKGAILIRSKLSRVDGTRYCSRLSRFCCPS